MSDQDREQCLATYYAMALRQSGYSPQAAAEAVALRYPATRPDLQARGLLMTREQRLQRWTDPRLAEEMESL